MDEITIGARLRTLRRWRGKTQVELAGLAGLPPSFLSMVESGQRPLDRRSHIAALASALRVSETDLVGGPHLTPDPMQSDAHGDTGSASRAADQHPHDACRRSSPAAAGSGRSRHCQSRVVAPLLRLRDARCAAARLARLRRRMPLPEPPSASGCAAWFTGSATW